MLCHSSFIIVIPSVFCHSFQIIVIPSVLMSLRIFVIQTSSHLPPIPEGRENWPAERAIFVSTSQITYDLDFNISLSLRLNKLLFTMLYS